MKHLMIIVALIATQARAQETTGRIYFLRSTGYNWGGAFKAFIDGKMVCNVQNKKFSVHEVKPGEHRFAVQFTGNEYTTKDEPVVINVEAGKSYYVQMAIKQKFAGRDLYCQEVTEGTAKTLMKELKEDSNCFQ